MWDNDNFIIPVVMSGFVRGRALPGTQLQVLIDDEPLPARAIHWLDGEDGSRNPDSRKHDVKRLGFEVEVGALLTKTARIIRVLDKKTGQDLTGSPLSLTTDGFSGKIVAHESNMIGGYIAGSSAAPTTPIALVAFSGADVLSFAVVRTDEVEASLNGYPFVLELPALPLGADARLVHVGVIGSNVVLGPRAILQRPESAVSRVRAHATTPRTIAIKIAAPNLRVAHEWGDYHFANALKKQFEQRGWLARVDCNDVWDEKNDEVDCVLVLRGRHGFKTNPGNCNLIWIISHPDRLYDGELDSYDHVFVASDVYAKTLNTKTVTPVSVLHQATDPEVFRPAKDPVTIHPVLFVGNSRQEYRTLVRWCVEKKIDISLFGTNWPEVVPSQLIKGEHIPNDDVYRYYSGCKILLNDHWDMMRDNGFLSNRLFDGSAAGAFILTDPVAGLSEVFGDAIPTVSTPEELAQKVQFYGKNEDAARAKALEAYTVVLKEHTFSHRADSIIAVINGMMSIRKTQCMI